MSVKTIVIGDVQGCYSPLMHLLDKAQFSDDDQLVFLGDLINRGPDSVKVMQFVDTYKSSIKVVLGNHDIHFLAVLAGVRKSSKDDTLDELLRHDDCAYWANFLRHQSLLLTHADHVMVHAGIWPTWSLTTAQKCAREIEQQLQADTWHIFLAHLFANTSGPWSETLSGDARAQFIVNTFTRMRFIDRDNQLNFHVKQKNSDNAHITPWFELLQSEFPLPILFGHWAALGLHHYPKQSHYRTLCLDSGCVWGGTLSAIVLPDREVVQFNNFK